LHAAADEEGIGCDDEGIGALALKCGEDLVDFAGRVLGSGRAWVSAATFEGREVVRACITNGKTTRRDIMAIADALQAAACRSA
jgi:hypothetical protein